MSHLRKLAKQFTKISNSLPEQYQISREQRLLKGTDVHLSGLDTEGIPNDDNEYLIAIPVYLKINHKRLIQKAYKRRGLQGVIEYVDSCMK